MPQISPMKWMILNIMTQSSILQTVLFLSMKKSYKLEKNASFLKVNKLCWKW